jgi:modulator of FtsH protease
MNIGQWNTVATAEVGAVAALAGLVFVALSINMTHILSFPGLVGRAAEALIMLLQPLFVGLAVLIPHQSVHTVGIEGIVVSAAAFSVMLRILLTSGRASSRTRPVREYRTRWALVLVAATPLIVGSIVMAAGSVDGMYWLTAGTAASIAVGIVDAWILLVEILR